MHISFTIYFDKPSDNMKTKKLLVISLLLLFTMSFVSCDNNEVDINQLAGKWSVWNDDPNLAVDSSIDYTFNTDGTCIIHTSSLLDPSSHTFNLKYTVSINSNTLTIYKNDMHIMENEIGAGKYHIIKLTSIELILDSMDNRNKTLKLRK